MAICGVVKILITYREYFGLSCGIIVVMCMYFPLIIYDFIVLWFLNRRKKK